VAVKTLRPPKQLTEKPLRPLERASVLSPREWASEWLPIPCYTCGGWFKHKPWHILGALKILIGCVSVFTPYSISLETPFLATTLYRKPLKLVWEVKIGRTWHDLMWDIKHQRSLIEHLLENL